MTTERVRLSTQLLALASMTCRPGAPRLNADELTTHLATLSGWTLAGDRIEKAFRFGDYHQTMAFVNALAWIAHTEDHHPDLRVGYDRCVVRYRTHSAGGITRNDFICATKADALVSFVA